MLCRRRHNIHLIHNSFRYAGRQHRDGIVKALKPVYTAPSEQAAKDRFAEFTAEWGQQYPAIVRLWESSWAEFVPFLEYGACRRMACPSPEGDEELARIGYGSELSSCAA